MDDYRYCPRCRTPLISAERGGRPRSVCPAAGCGFVAWNNPIPIVATIVERDDGIVLVRSRNAPPTWFGLVAGFLEPGEVPVEGAAREVGEELGLTGTPPEFVSTNAFPLRNQIIFTYHMRVPMQDIRLCEIELSEYRIVPVDRVVPWNRGTGPALSTWLAARGLYPEPVDFGRHIEG
jgi:NAD+ diphosphatase